jgi:hypothetical protein
MIQPRICKPIVLHLLTLPKMQTLQPTQQYFRIQSSNLKEQGLSPKKDELEVHFQIEMLILHNNFKAKKTAVKILMLLEDLQITRVI